MRGKAANQDAVWHTSAAPPALATLSWPIARALPMKGQVLPYVMGLHTNSTLDTLYNSPSSATGHHNDNVLPSKGWQRIAIERPESLVRIGTGAKGTPE
ncbi:hypothetical protein F4809DRAFT_639887 [Biscogniauxia mediterranea]|nr:hypothetical protein F4809DRAFT_639887 [Biscogniauxia mediterranea]